MNETSTAKSSTWETSAGEASAGEASAGGPSAGEASAGGPNAGGPSAGGPSAGKARAGKARAGKRISVFLLDDHEIVRRGLRDLLEAEPDIDVIGEAGTAVSALQRMPALRPDAAGGSVCREIRSTLPGTACLMLTSYGMTRHSSVRSWLAPRAMC